MAGLAIVTGGARGIGLAIVRALLEQKVVDEVAVLDIAPVELSEAKVYSCELTDEESVKDALAAIGEVPRVLVNNAGGSRANEAPTVSGNFFDPFPSVEDWRAGIDLNLTSAFIVTRNVAPRMEAGAAICNTASIAGVMPGPLQAYGAAKAAMIHWTRNLAFALAPRSIRVNAVAPGFIYTRLWEQLAPREMFNTMVNSQVPMHTEQTPEDIANSVAFLCSDRAAQITGQVIAIDGGTSNRSC
jgi:NAD(P)-dependent dehydrogenase (short-subunit alcohol dehydrogenase family)